MMWCVESFFHIKLERLWGIIILVSLFIFVNTHPIRPYDFWFHLAYGRLLAQTGHIPVVDTFSFTMSGQLYHSEYSYWLAQLFMYKLFEWGSLEWTILIFSLLITAAYAVLLVFGFTQTRNWRIAAFGLLFAAALGFSNWNIRPQSLIYLLAALSVVGIEMFRLRQHPKVWALILLVSMIIWVNCHGTFFIPFVLTGFWFVETVVETFWQKQFQSSLISSLKLIGVFFIGVLINPRGYGVFGYLFSMSKSESVQNYVTEWQPLSISEVDGAIFVVFLIAIIVMWIVTRQKVGLAKILSFIFFALLSIKYSRAIVWFGVTQVPLVLSLLSGLKLPRKKEISTQSKESIVLNITLLVLFCMLGIFSLPWFKSYWPVLPEKKGLYSLTETPVGATSYLLENDLPKRVFSDTGFSSYITWATDTQYKVFADPRLELYPAKLWKDYIQIGNAIGDWNDKLSSYGVDTLVLAFDSQHPLIDAARLSDDWQQVYVDEVAAVFVRKQ